MNEKLELGVYRPFDHPETQSFDPPDSPRALKSHYQRRGALQDALVGIDGWDVKDWGKTEDTKAHEFVELTLVVLENPQFQAIAVPALKYVGDILATAAVGAGMAEAVKTLIARLWPKQKEKKIADCHITLPDGPSISCDPLVAGAAIADVTITTRLQNGKSFTVQYSATDEDIASQGQAIVPRRSAPEP